MPLDVCFGDQLAGFMTIGNLCIAVGTRSLLSDRNFGALFEVLCVGWMNLRLCDAYRIIMPMDT